MSSLEKFGALPPDYCVPDLLAMDLNVVFCGTALGRISAEKRAYYANPGNFFWRTLLNIGLIPEAIKPQDYARLLDFGIGLTDLCKAHYGNDVELPAVAFDSVSLHDKIMRYQPRYLAFTSKTGASVFLKRSTEQITLGIQLETLGRTQLYVLPSPSGQARIYWDPSIWQALAEAVSHSL